MILLSVAGLPAVASIGVSVGYRNVTVFSRRKDPVIQTLFTGITDIGRVWAQHLRSGLSARTAVLWSGESGGWDAVVQFGCTTMM